MSAAQTSLFPLLTPSLADVRAKTLAMEHDSRCSSDAIRQQWRGTTSCWMPADHLPEGQVRELHAELIWQLREGKTWAP